MRQSAFVFGITASALALALSGCGGGDKGSTGTAGKETFASGQPVGAPRSGSKGVAMNISLGPDVCFKAITKHLGAETKVAEMTSFFATNGDLGSSSSSDPEGALTLCKADYQSPADPRKLVSVSMDVETGEFSAPQPVEITVMGDAASFKLEDHIIPLSQINAAGLTGIMESEKARLKGVYSRYAWSGVRLMGPGAFSDVHTLRLDVDGRLASNDIKQNGFASISLDGKKIIDDNLLP